MNQSPAASSAVAAGVLHRLVGALQQSGVLAAATGGAASAGGAGASGGFADDELMLGVVQVEQLGRIVDSLRVWVAGQLAIRSVPELGDEGLARSQNFVSVPKFLAAVTGTRVSSAKALVRLASRVHTTMSLVGLPNLPQFPAVAPPSLQE